MESPKTRWQKNPLSNPLLDTVNKPEVIQGLDMAILQLGYEMGTAKTPESAAAMHWQSTGAYRLREIFLALSAKESKPIKPKSDNLPNEI